MAKPLKNKDAEVKWLSEAMDGQDVGPKDLAAKTGLDPNWISQWKIGNRPMTDIGMLKIGRALNLSPYEVRPPLLEYAEFFKDSSIIDDLSDESKRIILENIAHLRSLDSKNEVHAGVFVRSSHRPRKKA